MAGRQIAVHTELTKPVSCSHIVIVDEAHNLIDSILQMHSVNVTLSMLVSTRVALLTYIQKFKTRFTGANATYLKQLALILKGLCEFAGRWASAEPSKPGSNREEMMSVQRLLSEAGGAVDQINLLKLDTYLRTYKIARKVSCCVNRKLTCALAADLVK